MAIYTLCLVAVAHVLPPYDVERAIQVTATPDEIRIDYRFGLGEEALRDELARLDPDRVVPEDPVAAARRHMELAAKEVGERLSVQIGERRYPLELQELDLIYQHHFRASCRFRVNISDVTGRVQVRVEDRNFSKYPGHIQRAAKKRGPVFYFDTVEAPILLRADLLPVSSGEAFSPTEFVFQMERSPPRPSPVTNPTDDVATSDTTSELSSVRQDSDGHQEKRAPRASWTPTLLTAGLLLLLLLNGYFAIRR
jgi:hypothetical protein